MSKVSSETESELDSEFSDKTDLISKASNFCPFTVKWVFGINSTVPVINLTTKKRTLIAYASSHVAVLYDYCSREMFTLQGHANEVQTLSTNSNGKWLLTADFGKDSVVVVWDTEKCLPICTLFNPHNDAGMTAAKISFDAKFIVTVGNENCQILKIWLWTLGKNVADSSIELSATKRDRVKEISFNDNNSDQFILTLEYQVLLVTRENENLNVQDSRFKKREDVGVFNNSLFLSLSNKAITTTSRGFILLWTLEEKRATFQKAIQLEKCSITQIARQKNTIVLGTSQGHVKFYDEDLKILYSCNDCDFDSINSLSFDLSSEFVSPKLKKRYQKDDKEEDDYHKASDYSNGSDKSSENSESIQNTDISESVENESVDVKTESNFTFTLENTYETKNINTETAKNNFGPTDATMDRKPLEIERFFICTKTGQLAWLDVRKLKCRFISYSSESVVTSLDLHSNLPYVVTGTSSGFIRLFNYVNHRLMICKELPDSFNFSEIFNRESLKNAIIHVSNLNIRETSKSVTVLKYSPKSDMLICGLESGVMWILHPDSLTPMDEVPFKHSTEAILNVVFSENSHYMAYSDNAMTVAVFKKAKPNFPWGFWNFLGKCRFQICVKELLFEPTFNSWKTARLFSLGTDQFLVEYDLANSGPYPEPGLKILNSTRIELNAVPLSIAWYPQIEDMLVLSNSEYKFRLVSSTTKKIQGTFLGPTFGTPVRIIKILSAQVNGKIQSYIIFVTEKEIGLQKIPLDGNPYKQISIIGHHEKIKKICVSSCKKFLFTLGSNDRCVLMWKIHFRSVEEMSELGGEGIEPFYPLIDGGKSGRFFQEIKDLFYYSQILQQGENIPEPRVITDKISIQQVANLLRSLGYYPSNEELQCMIYEVSHRTFVETGKFADEINFQDFVKLYINHRPAFGVSLRQFKKVFQTFGDSTNFENPTLSRDTFLDLLLGTDSSESSRNWKFHGDTLSPEEAFSYLKVLLQDKNPNDDPPRKISRSDFDFLPERISYKDFATDFMGIELPKERRADKNFV